MGPHRFIIAGNYTVKVQAKGFATTETNARGFKWIQRGQFQLQVGAETTTVTVEAAAAGVNTETDVSAGRSDREPD